jgi:hypothetical protein
MKDDKYTFKYEPQNRGLVNRVPFSTTLLIPLSSEIRVLSLKTRIPISRLLDEAIEDLLIKHKKAT